MSTTKTAATTSTTASATTTVTITRTVTIGGVLRGSSVLSAFYLRTSGKDSRQPPIRHRNMGSLIVFHGLIRLEAMVWH